ncbi:alpha/beta hydrolase [Microbacterium sp. Se5.02b]|uniref:alpha/beta hydrolase n=1 Tax=Microbacterium sp. Se5.02b TaxID=2864103 RepID=UPI001C6875FA|nr:alpha/beta hydrolase [Microbacterium sp. Se5.02b]QYM64893.1 alpha/beta hydrolase family protein [Microbacterium sp. Se5.02b]
MSLTSPNRGYPLERLDGNTGSMAYWSNLFTRVADRLGDLRTAAHAAQDLPGVGRSVTAVRTDANDLAGALPGDIAEAQLLAGVLQRYADAFDAHAKPANDLIDDIEAAHAEWSRLNIAADHAGRAAMAAAYGDDQSEIDDTNDAVTEAIGVRDAAKDALDELWTQYERFYGDWDAAYAAALSELAGGTGAVLTNEARDLLADLLAATSPEEVARLWAENPELQQELIDNHPAVVGNLDGVPWDVRATVNAARLEELLETEPEGPHRDELAAVWRALTTGAVPKPNLISFDPDGAEQVTAALAYGDLSTASEINTLVPGMNGNVDDLFSWGQSAQALNLRVGEGSATVVWFGYDTPDLLEEPAMSRAEDGAAALRSYLLAVRALSPDADVNVIAHSYGSTTAALAIGSQADGLGVTSFIAVGSAGFPKDPTVVENLSNGGPPQLYATISEDDAVARVGRGTAPGHPVSPERLPGATVFDSDGGVDARGESLPAATGHDALGPGAYLEPGSESFYNVGEIIMTGQPGTERGGEGSTQGFWDAGNWWISDEYALIDF